MSFVRILKGNLYRGSPGSAGFDLFATENVIIPPCGQALVKTGLVTQFSSDLVALIRDRSGLAANNRLTTRAGVIDSDYDREWGVVLVNENPPHLGPEAIKKIYVGDRIAQVIFMKIAMPDVDVFDDSEAKKLSTEWGIHFVYANRDGGFGSTGTR